MRSLKKCLLARICGTWDEIGRGDRRFLGMSGHKEWLGFEDEIIGPGGAVRQGQRDILPALAWLSLAGLLDSRARLCFTKQYPV